MDDTEINSCFGTLLGDPNKLEQLLDYSITSTQFAENVCGFQDY